MNKVIRIIITLLVLGGAIGVVVWKLNDNKQVINEQAKLAQERNDVIPVKTVVLARQTISSKFKSSGQFQPFQELALVSDVSGRVTQLNVKNGSSVNEGAVILTVDNDLLKNQLDIAVLNLKKAEHDLTRLKNLIGDGGITQQQVNDAENAVENLKAQIRGLEKQISLTVIKAPISGIVSGKTIEKGAFIGPGAPILNIVNVARLKFQVNLSEEEVVQVKIGQQVSLSADLYPDKTFSGVISFISAKADNARRFMVEVELNNPASNPLKGGMNGYAFFDSGKSATLLALPREAIVGSVRDAKVSVVENSVAQLKPVRLGVIYGDFAAVEDGLKEGDVIVIAGQINLEDGTKVEVSSK